MSPEQLHGETVDRFNEHVNPYLGKLMNFAGFGVEVRAEGCYVWDHDGNRYLDFLGGYGVFSLGHRHPHVVEAVKAQLDLMPLSSKVFFGARMAELAEKLAEIAPEGLKYAFFCNSGAEACEGALKFAKGATGRPKIVSTIGGFHGKTLGALATTGRDKYRAPFNPLMPGVEFVPFGDLRAMDSAIDEQTAAVIVEPIQGEGGIHVPPDGYLRLIRDRCTSTGALMIADEVQTGLGRTGRMFGCNWEAVRPDLMTLAKALGGGIMPIGAVLGTEEVWSRVYSANPLMHTSTFGGNPMACAAGVAAIEATLRDDLPARALVLGERLMAGLRAVQQKHPELLAEVRGRGLLVGVEFTMDEVGELTIAQMTKRGLIAAYTLNNPRVIRFEPPLIVSESQIDEAAAIFGDALSETKELIEVLV